MPRDWLWWSLAAAFSAMLIAFLLVLLVSRHLG
jgi:hypothetical protein